MERVQAEAILDGEREAAVVLLMRVGELIEANRRLETRVAELEQRLNRNSRNSSLPLARVDEVIEHWPERCQACARAFGACERVDAAPVQRHQVVELPPIAVTL